MKQNSLKYGKEYWFPETKANPFFRKVKIARLFGMDLDNILSTGHTHWSFIGHPKRIVYKIPVGDINKSKLKSSGPRLIKKVFYKIKCIVSKLIYKNKK